MLEPAAGDESVVRFAAHLNAHCESFRWHVSGDVFSPEYARWIADVCRETPTVKHWMYTRSFDDDILRELAAVATVNGGNLALNISCDTDNIEEAVDVSIAYGAEQQPLRLCYLTVNGAVPLDISGADVVFPDYRLRGGTEEGRAWFAGLEPYAKAMVCPVDFNGKAENRRCGPCTRCLT